MSKKAEEIAKALDLLGAAWRGDWLDFDGRTLRAQLEELSAYLKDDDVEFNLQSWAYGISICPVSRSWAEHCDERSEGVGTYSCNHLRTGS